MILHEGKMTLRELSSWFGLAPDSISKSSKAAKEKKFKILETYAEFHFEGKSLIIDRVKQPTYTRAFDIIEEEMPKRWGRIPDGTHQIQEILYKERIDTCARVGKDIWLNIPEVQSQISERTTQNYTNQVKIQKYGHNYLNDCGTLGHSEYVWMNQTNDAPLDEAGLTILKECANLAYGDVNILLAAIDDDYHIGCMSKEERDAAIGSLDTMECYDKFVMLLIQKLGFKPEKRTRLIDDVGSF